MRDQRLAVGRDDARRFLPAMLQRVQPEVREVGGLRMAVDAEHAALFMEAVELGLFDRLDSTDKSCSQSCRFEPPGNASS